MHPMHLMREKMHISRDNLSLTIPRCAPKFRSSTQTNRTEQTKMTHTPCSKPDNTDDVIDSRDIIAWIAELSDETRDEDDVAYLASLKRISEQAEGYGDWEYGETLIRDSYFKNYAMELAEDCGMINKDAKWPNNCIDWDKAARELQMDYTSIDFDGVTYWMRA